MATGHRRRLLATALIVAVGAAGLFLPVFDAVSGGVQSTGDALWLLIPLVPVGLLWATAYWTWRDVTNGRDALVVAVWCLGFAGAAASITGTVILIQSNVGGRIVNPWMLTNGVGLVGGTLGCVVGYFHVGARVQGRQYKEARDTLTEQKQRLLFINRLLRHDIRNDVNVIHGYAELLTEQYPEEPHLETILRKSEEIEHLTKIASNLCELAKSLPTQPTRLLPAIEDAVQQARDSFPDAEIRIEDRQRANVAVMANEILPVIFQNLLRNAIQHNDKPTPTVEIAPELTEESVQVRISDNGPGIPEAIRHALFQAEKKGPESKGTGMGLYLVETLATSYGGDVWIADGDGDGTTIIVELPRADV